MSYSEISTYARAGYSVPSISATASRGMHGKLYASIANLDPNEAQKITIEIVGGATRNPTGEI